MKQQEEFPDFSGKCISLSIMEDSHSHDLCNPYFEYQGGRLFIIGTVPEGSTVSNWASGFQGAVAWDRVTDYVLFDNVEAYTSAIMKSEEYHKQSPDKNED